MRVLLVGDVHGRVEELCSFLGRARSRYRVGRAIQVGDFGLGPGALGRSLYFPVPLHVIDGNHEDHGWLAGAARDGASDGWGAAHNLFFQPRGSVLPMGDGKVGFLGGALHVDRPQELHRASGASNFIQRGEAEAAARRFNDERPDLIVTHTCPAGIGVGVRSGDAFGEGLATHVVGAGFDPGPRDDCGDLELTRLWRALAYRPRGWVFGHFHQRHAARVEGTEFHCLRSFDPALDFPLVLWDDRERRVLVLGG